MTEIQAVGYIHASTSESPRTPQIGVGPLGWLTDTARSVHLSRSPW
jgi:hypothetical protein